MSFDLGLDGKRAVVTGGTKGVGAAVVHLALPPPRRLMRILGSIVHPSPALMAVLDPKLSNRGAV
jgi:NAD(P)-dependent dehydrogenase (short-subunit alcohol dehydrogenase family)